MFIVLIYILCVFLFCLTFYLTKLVKTCRMVLSIAHNAVAIMSDVRLNDLDKEKAIQKSALRMTNQWFIILIKFSITCLVAACPLWLSSTLQLASINEIGEFAMRWDVIVITTIAMLIPIFIWRT